MTYRSFRRVFTNNSKYRSYDKIPYFDSLAHTVEEVLYKRNFKGCDYCHYLGIIQLFDFMTLVAYFISASSEDFARATIKGYLTEMKHYKSGNQYDTQVEYTAEGDLLVTNAKEELITDLLWATHLYATFRFELDEAKEHWRNTMDMLYEIMMEESDWESELAKTDKDSYLEANKVAMKILIEHWLKNKDTDVKELKTEVPKDIDSKCVSQLQARIAELEAENVDLKEQLEQVRNREKGISSGINQAQTALFGLSLANTFGFKFSNKRDLAPLLHSLFGWGKTKLSNLLATTDIENEKRDELANLFKDLCPPLYETIMNRGQVTP